VRFIPKLFMIVGGSGPIRAHCTGIALMTMGYARQMRGMTWVAVARTFASVRGNHHYPMYRLYGRPPDYK
jgi:hypothetical protein